MRLKLDSVTHARSNTQDGTRTKFALRFQLLDPVDREEAFELVGQTLDARFEREQESLPGIAPQTEDRSNSHVANAVDVDEEEPVAIPSNGRRRHGTRSSEQA
jgi:hypothetical protein